MKNAEYYDFLKSINGETPDTLGKEEEETVASPQEIGWWRQYQIRRAIHHARYGKATPVEIRLLKNHDIPLSSQAIERTKKSAL